MPRCELLSSVRLRLHLGFNLFLFSCLISSSEEWKLAGGSLGLRTLILMISPHVWRHEATQLAPEQLSWARSQLWNMTFHYCSILRCGKNWNCCITKNIDGSALPRTIFCRVSPEPWARIDQSKLGKTIQKSISLNFPPLLCVNYE